MSKPREGDWFAVRVTTDAYAVGLVTRHKRGRTLFGYFFGPFRSTYPSAEELGALTPRTAVFLARFYDEALVSGRWPVIASMEGWQRGEWPMPEFQRALMRELTGESSVIRYSEDNPDKPVSRRPITFQEEADYPPDEGVFPPEHVEHRLRELFGIQHEVEEEPGEIGAEEGVRYFLLLPRDRVDAVRRQLGALGLTDVEVLDERDGGLADVEVLQRGSIRGLRASADDMEARLTALARKEGGEYDGLEWALPES